VARPHMREAPEGEEIGAVPEERCNLVIGDLIVRLRVSREPVQRSAPLAFVVANQEAVVDLDEASRKIT
jgi:hypothetical protein